MAINSIKEHVASIQEPYRTHWNSRYLYYCQAHGFNDPEVMLERDQAFWPGGCMTGFMCWIREAWWMAVVELCVAHHCRTPDDFQLHHSDSQAQFDKWLSENFMKVPREPEEKENEEVD